MNPTPAPPEKRRITPGAAGIILVFALALAALTTWLLRVAIQLFVIATLLALAIGQPVSWLERRGVPRTVAVIGIMIAVIAAAAVLLAVFTPVLFRQAAELVDNLPSYWRDLQQRLQELAQNYPWIQERIAEADISGEVTKRAHDLLATGWSFAVGLTGAVMLMIMLVITTVFMLINPRPLADGIIGLVPEPWTPRARQIAAMLLERIRAWLRGLVILGGIVGVMVGVGLSLLGVPYATVFGVLAGLLEMVPTLGPVLSAIPPILVALALEPIRALYVVALFVVVQQLENALLVPFVMRRQLQLHPVSTIFGFLALGTLFGLFGAIVAVPAVACLKVLYDEIYYPWAHPQAR